MFTNKKFSELLILFLVVKSLYAQTSWTRDTTNPIIASNNWTNYVNDVSAYKYALRPSVMFDDEKNVYRMWFNSLAYGGGTAFCISEAVSVDGVTWFVNAKNPEVVPTLGTFDENGLSCGSVIKDNQGYKLYYSGYNHSLLVYEIGLATSVDGTHWTKYVTNPIMKVGLAGSWDTKG